MLRCERVIQEKKNLDEQGIRMRRLREINERLTTDRITAHQIKQDHNFTKLTKLTWKLLEQNGTLPFNWFQK